MSGYVMNMICFVLQERSNERISLIRDTLITQLNSSLCPSCRLSSRTIVDEELSCRDHVNQVVFRARIIGSSQYSANGLVDLLQSWVEGGAASISLNSVRYHIDPSCSTSLDSPDAPDCAVVTTTTTTSMPPVETTTTTTTAVPPAEETTTTIPPVEKITTTTTAIPPVEKTTPPSVSVQKITSQNSISSGEIGGLVIGVIIVVLLFLVIVLVAVLIIRTFRGTFG